MLPDASMLSVSMVPGSGTDASQEHKRVCLAGCHEHLPACLLCENRVLDGPASGEKGSKGRNKLDCQDLVLTKPVSAPTSIKFNRFIKLILLEHKPLLACFGFATRQKWPFSKTK